MSMRREGMGEGEGGADPSRNMLQQPAIVSRAILGQWREIGDKQCAFTLGRSIRERERRREHLAAIDCTAPLVTAGQAATDTCCRDEESARKPLSVRRGQDCNESLERAGQ